MDGIIRRRGMVEKASNGLLYSLYDHPVSRGDSINTGITFLEAGDTRTFLLDYTTTENVTSQSGTGGLVKYIYVSGPSNARYLTFGKYSGAWTHCSYWWMATSNSDYSDASNSSPSAGRKRLLITHEAGSNVCSYYWKFNNSALASATKTKTFTATSNPVMIGYGGGTQLLVAGTINKAEIYDRILTADEINAFFA